MVSGGDGLKGCLHSENDYEKIFALAAAMCVRRNTPRVGVRAEESNNRTGSPGLAKRITDA